MKYLGTCSISLTMLKIQIKTVQRFHLASIRMCETENLVDNKFCSGYGGTEAPIRY